MKIGIMTDAHLPNATTPPAAFHNPYHFANVHDNVERAIARHIAAGVDLIVYLGDLANAGDDIAHRRGLDLLGASGVPVWLVPGNHDGDEELNALASRIGTHHASAVRVPTPTGEALGAFRLAGLSLWDADLERGWALEQPDVAAWGDAPTLLLTHFMAIFRREAAAAAGLRYAGDVRNHREIAAALRGRPAPTVVLHGHHHVRDAVVDGTVLQIGFASLIEPPHETAVLQIERSGDVLAVQVEHLPVAPSAATHLPILALASGAWRFAAGMWEQVTVS